MLTIVEQAGKLTTTTGGGCASSGHWVGVYPDGSPGVPTANDSLASGYESDPDVVAYLKATEVGNAKAAGAVLALQGTDDAFMATFETLIGKLEAQGDDLQYVILPGQRHDYALQFGWPWAKAFLEDRLPLAEERGQNRRTYRGAAPPSREGGAAAQRERPRAKGTEGCSRTGGRR